MGLFKYPYTDLNELNLDWVLARIKELTEYVATITHADKIEYDNTGTSLTAENVQQAINEIENMITTGAVTSFNGRTGEIVPAAGDYDANIVDYDNTNSGLVATETQSAIDELAARPLGGVESFNARTGAVVPTAGDYGASDVTYDNTGSGLIATDVQAAIDEVDNKIPATIVESFNTRTGAVLPAAGDYEADDITYDNTTSGLTATDTQAAIDELDNRLDNFSVAASQVSYDNTVSGLTATDAQAALDEIANDVLSSGVASFKGRTGAVTPASGDYTAATTDTPEASKTLAAVEGTTASTAYKPGERFIDKDGYMSIAITSIASGATLTLNTNYEHHTIGEQNALGKRIAVAAHGSGRTWNDLLKELHTSWSALDSKTRAKSYIEYDGLIFNTERNGSSMGYYRVAVGASSITTLTLSATTSAGHRYTATTTSSGTTFTDETSNEPTKDVNLYIY